MSELSTQQLEPETDTVNSDLASDQSNTSVPSAHSEHIETEKHSEPNTDTEQATYEEEAVSDQYEYDFQLAHRLFSKTTINIVLSRSLFYLIFMMIILNAHYPDMTRFFASVIIISLVLASTFLVIFLKGINPILLKYIRLALAVFDLGIISSLFYLNGGSSSTLLLAFPIFVWAFSINGMDYHLITVASLSIIFSSICKVAFTRFSIFSSQFLIEMLLQIGLLIWMVGFSEIMRKLKKADISLSLLFIKLLGQLIDKLPDEYASKLKAIFFSEGYKILESEFRKRFSHLISVIVEKENLIKAFKEPRSAGTTRVITKNGANTLVELQKVSLAEENEKLLDLNHTLEEKVKVLTKELDTVNMELERMYSR